MDRISTPTTIDRTVDGIVEAMLSEKATARSVWIVSGQEGTGKSTLASVMAERLSREHLKPIVIDPPRGYMDTAAVAVIQLSSSLHRHGLVNGAFDRSMDPGTSWGAKLRDMRGAMEAARDDLVLICDEPDLWCNPRTSAERFDVHAREMATTLQEAPCRRVILTRRPRSTYAREVISLPRSLPALESLREPDAWGAYGQVAKDIANTCGGKVRGMTVLQLRLLTALVVLTSMEEARSTLERGTTRFHLSMSLRSALAKSGEHAVLLNLWDRMALVRRPFTDELMTENAAGDLSPFHHDVFTFLMLNVIGDKWVMNETLRADARRENSLSRKETRSVSARLAKFYQSISMRCEPDHGATSRLEAVYHASFAGNRDLVQEIGVSFTDQLAVLGRSLSQDLGKYDEAAEVFRLAIQLDDDDDYAHHYFAFNLDIQGKEPALVESEYKRAIEINPENIWWRTRFINFLITRGRSGHARQAWDDAQDDLKSLLDPDDDFIYLHMHLWVARLLLHRGQLEFAQDVLDDIPSAIRTSQPRLVALGRHLGALRQESEVGSVIPFNIPPGEWWNGPHLCSRTERGGAVLDRWLPGCVEAINDGGVRILVAIPPVGERQPEFGHVDLSVGEFDNYSRDQKTSDIEAGRFVELGFYGGEPDPVIRVHPRGGADPDLPPLVPSPTRYIERR